MNYSEKNGPIYFAFTTKRLIALLTLVALFGFIEGILVAHEVIGEKILYILLSH